ncbi:splicing factor [Cryptosporidium ryanae]|uniref:splicing factor n=1 Tax=Cryptosporidium ryanae TaxID=515981 RepID=UPI00351A40A4|nr:splicing factor [Cryptosporidium ryanae]
MKEFIIEDKNPGRSYKRNHFERSQSPVGFRRDNLTIRSQNGENRENSNSKRTNINIKLEEYKDTSYQNTNNVGSDMSISKGSREVYVGNLPGGIDVAQLMKFINSEISDNCDIVYFGNPVVSAWINSDGKYAFCECKSIDIANHLLGLNNTLNLNGNLLRIGRPKINGISNINEIKSSSSISTNQLSQNLGIISPYFSNIPLIVSKKEPFLITRIKNFHNIEDIRESVSGRINISILDLIDYKRKYKIAICEVETSDIHSLGKLFEIFDSKINILNISEISENNKIIKFLNTTLLKKIKNIQVEEYIDYKNSRECFGIYSSLVIPNYPCRCIMLSRLLTFEEVTADFIDLIATDIKNECYKFGEVMKFKILRPEEVSCDTRLLDLHIGSVFVLYKTVEEAINAKLNLYKMRFLGRSVKVKYFSESRFLDIN